MSNDQDPLNSYIRFLVEQRDRRNQELSREEMKRIALEMGLSEADLQQAEQIAHDHHVRAQNFMQHQRYQDAVDELKQAAPLLARDVPLHLDLARCYLGLNDAKQAEHWARYCLQLDPSAQDAVALLNQIDHNQGRRQVAAKRKSRTGLFVALGAMGCLIPLIGIIGIVTFQGNSVAPPPTPTPTTTTTPRKTTPTTTAKIDDKHRDIPLTLSGAEHLVLERPHSRLNNYTKSSFYKMTALLRNTSDQDFVEIRARLYLRNQAGTDLVIKDLTPFRKMNGAYVEPGEAIPVNYTAHAKTDVTDAELVITIADQEPHSQLYQNKPIEFQWAVQKPDLAELAISERRRTLREMFNKRESMRLSLVFTNRSPSPLALVKFELDVFDADGKLLTNRKGYAVSQAQPTILAGESRAYHMACVYDGKMADYRLRIIEIQ